MGQPPGGQINSSKQRQVPTASCQVSSDARSFTHPFPGLVVAGKFPFLRMAQTIPVTVSPRLEADAISLGAPTYLPRDSGWRQGCRLQERRWGDASKNSAVWVWDKA